MDANEKTSFDDIDICLPDFIKDYSYEKQQNILEYLKQMDHMQKKAYLIAQHHLGTSFNIYRSNGFKEFIKNKK